MYSIDNGLPDAFSILQLGKLRSLKPPCLSQKLLHQVFHRAPYWALLFIVYMNDMVVQVKQSELGMYVDDSTLVGAGKTLGQIEQKFDEDK